MPSGLAGSAPTACCFMPAPSKVFPKSAEQTTPCVCCLATPHEHVVDRDLGGYVCRDCGKKLRMAKEWLEDVAGYPGCLGQNCA